MGMIGGFVNAKVNNVSKEGCIEFYYINSNINYDGALDTAKKLLDRGTDKLKQMMESRK